MGEAWTADGPRQELETTGEIKVRAKLRAGAWHSDKALIVEEWLREKDQERADTIAADTRRNTKITHVIGWLGVLAMVAGVLVAIVALK